MHTLLNRRCRHATLPVAAALGIVLATPPASAHVEVSADGAQAGTGPVTLSFSAESESSSAGIVGMATRLPTGITPVDVSLASGPAGWTLTSTTDGFQLAGPDLGPGVDAEYSVTIARLPADTTELVFPTLQRYPDGREDAWIDPVTDALPNPDQPAPVLAIAPAPPAATTTPSSSAAPPTQDSPSATAQPETVSQSAEEESNTGTIALVAGVLAVAAIGVAAWAWRSRRTR